MNASMNEDIPKKIGRYRIDDVLGRGGMALVYLAFDPYMERKVAIKVLSKERIYDDSLRIRFKRESRMVASLNHPAIVPVYDFGEENEQPYLVMRYMEGGSLREKLGKVPLPLTEVAAILNQIAPALDTTHSHNIIHRDLKPSNILFDEKGKAHLADFGLAKFAEGTYTPLTHTNGMVGTPAYMSPEQIRGQSHLDGRTDIYALGVILFEMLAGQQPFAADGSLPIALMHLSDPVPTVHTFNLSLPESISQIIIRAMAKNREDRFATASELTIPFIEVAKVEALPAPEPSNTPPIILQPDSESGSGVSRSGISSGSTPAKEVLPEWLQSWLANYGTKQDIGRSRTRGTLEDRFRVGNVQTAGGLQLLIAMVSDGGSSQQHGHLAAELTIQELFSQIEQAPTAVPNDIPEMLHQAIQNTNHIVFNVAKQHREPPVMQSMVVLAAIHENRLFIAHVGNGRIYLLRNRSLHQLTRSTPLLPAPTNGSRNGQSSAIGIQPELHIDLGLYLDGSEDNAAARQNQGLQLQINDRLLLCSDGLLAPNANGWQRHRLRQVISENQPTAAANLLVQDALKRNVPDNATAVVLQTPGSLPYVPLRQTRPFQLAAAGTLVTFFFFVALFFISNRPQPDASSTQSDADAQIAQFIAGLTATAAADPDPTSTAEFVSLRPPDSVPDPGFAVIFAAGEGALFRQNVQEEWKTARAGDMVRIGENAAIRSGNDRMGVVLSDGAELYLASETELALKSVYQVADDAKVTQVSLAYGRLLIHYKNADPHDFELDVPSEAKLRLSTANNVVGVIYNEATQTLETDCFSGSCRLQNNRNSDLLLPIGRYGIVEGSNLTTRSVARVTLYCDLAPTLVACPTATPPPTQTLPPIVQTVIAGTATANAQTATPTPSFTPSNTPSPTPSPSVTPLPTITPQPAVSSTPVPPTTGSTTMPPTATSSRPASSTPINTPRPTSTITPVNTTVPSNTPVPEPTDTSTPRFIATPLPTLTPTSDPSN
jgi:serine/threonine protein kinase